MEPIGHEIQREAIRLGWGESFDGRVRRFYHPKVQRATLYIANAIENWRAYRRD